jgi:hypothetical protein
MKVSLTFEISDGPSHLKLHNVNWITLQRKLTLFLMLVLSITATAIAVVVGVNLNHDRYTSWRFRPVFPYVLGLVIPSVVISAFGYVPLFNHS